MDMGLQPARIHGVAASLAHIGLQPGAQRVAARGTWGCSLGHIGLQPSSPSSSAPSALLPSRLRCHALRVTVAVRSWLGLGSGLGIGIGLGLGLGLGMA